VAVINICQRVLADALLRRVQSHNLVARRLLRRAKDVRADGLFVPLTPRSLPLACIRCSVYFSGSVKG
jgi:hypothetical protein